MGAGAHAQEKNSSLTSTDQNAKVVNLVVLVMGSGGHISTIVLWQTYPGHCKDRRKYLQGVFSHAERAGRDCCVVTLLNKNLHVIQ